MPFQDLPEGQTHFYGDGCDSPHGQVVEKAHEVKCTSCGCECTEEEVEFEEEKQLYFHEGRYCTILANNGETVMLEYADGTFTLGSVAKSKILKVTWKLDNLYR